MGTGIYTGTEVYWQWWDQWGEGAVGGGVDTPKRLLTIFKTRRKFEIENTSL
jgi:hypothetical protein